MSNYRKTIKFRILLLSLLIILSVILGVYDVFWAGPELKETSIYGFQIGIIISLGLLSIAAYMRLRALLKDESALMLQFNKENDERIKAIKAKAGIPMLPIMSTLMIIAGIFAGYYDNIIFITLVAAAVFQLIVCLIMKMVFMKKM